MNGLGGFSGLSLFKRSQADSTASSSGSGQGGSASSGAKAGAEGQAGAPNSGDQWGLSALNKIQQWRDVMQTSLFGSESAERTTSDEGAKSHEMRNTDLKADDNGGTRDSAFMQDCLKALCRGVIAEQDMLQRNKDKEDRGDFSLSLEIDNQVEANTPAAAAGDEGGIAPPAQPNSSRKVQFLSHSPLLFAVLRQGFNIGGHDYRATFEAEGFRVLKPATSKSGRCFYMTSDDKFIVKSVTPDEAEFLLEILNHYFAYVSKYPQTLLPKFLGLYVMTEKGRELILSVEANAFSSQCPIHERYDLKGSMVGRLTKEEAKAKDANIILKDLDLNRQLPLGLTHRSLLLAQLKHDCKFLENLEIVDYSMLLGVHHPHLHAPAPSLADNIGLAPELSSELNGVSPTSENRTESNPQSDSTQGLADESKQSEVGQMADTAQSISGEDSLSAGETAGAKQPAADVAASSNGEGHQDLEKKTQSTQVHSLPVASSESASNRKSGDWSPVVGNWKFVSELHCSDFDAKVTFNPNKVVVILVAAGDKNCASLCGQTVCAVDSVLESNDTASSITALILDLDTCSPHLVMSLKAFNLPSVLCFHEGEEVLRVVGAPSVRAMKETFQNFLSIRPSDRGSRTFSVGPSVPMLRKDWNGVEGKAGDVYYFGIVDVLQPYNLKKQLEHSLKSLVQDKNKMTIVEPALYSQRFQAYISSIVI